MKVFASSAVQNLVCMNWWAIILAQLAQFYAKIIMESYFKGLIGN